MQINTEIVSDSESKISPVLAGTISKTRNVYIFIDLRMKSVSMTNDEEIFAF